MFDIDKITSGIIKEYQKNNSVSIFLNSEGPCAKSIGLYTLLDDICDKFEFDKNKITIFTNNEFETHNIYNVYFQGQHWFGQCAKYATPAYQNIDHLRNKDVTTNLFGCLYNIPTWSRLCLLTHLKFNTTSQSILACNVSYTKTGPTLLSLDQLILNAPNELFNVVDYLKTSPKSLFGDEDKPLAVDSIMKATDLYSTFFIDIVAETFTQGNTFFVTEKTIRPLYAYTPFIIYGPKHFLSTLKNRYGFKTFSQWWNEDYDNYEDYERIKKIYYLVDQIDKLTLNERQTLFNDMKEVLEFNHNRLKEIVSNYE